MRFKDMLRGIKREPIGVKVKSEDGLKNIVVPKYGLRELPPGYCSRFVRLAARDMFGLEYPVAHAWELRNKGCRADYLGEWDLDEAYRMGDLKQGDAVGMFYSGSRHNGKFDSLGNTRQYTHVGLFLGESPWGHSLIADEFLNVVRVSTARYLKAEGILPVEILHPLRANKR